VSLFLCVGVNKVQYIGRVYGERPGYSQPVSYLLGSGLPRDTEEEAETDIETLSLKFKKKVKRSEVTVLVVTHKIDKAGVSGII
jgi:hypothetical protein